MLERDRKQYRPMAMATLALLLEEEELLEGMVRRRSPRMVHSA